MPSSNKKATSPPSEDQDEDQSGYWEIRRERDVKTNYKSSSVSSSPTRIIKKKSKMKKRKTNHNVVVEEDESQDLITQILYEESNHDNGGTSSSASTTTVPSTQESNYMAVGDITQTYIPSSQPSSEAAPPSNSDPSSGKGSSSLSYMEDYFCCEPNREILECTRKLLPNDGLLELSHDELPGFGEAHQMDDGVCSAICTAAAGGEPPRRINPPVMLGNGPSEVDPRIALPQHVLDFIVELIHSQRALGTIRTKKHKERDEKEVPFKVFTPHHKDDDDLNL